MKLYEAFEELIDKLPVDKGILDRLYRAYNLVKALGGYDIKKANNVYHVSRLSTSLFEDNSATYIVTAQSCTCPDYEKARANLCKHRLAIQLIELMEGKTDEPSNT